MNGEFVNVIRKCTACLLVTLLLPIGVVRATEDGNQACPAGQSRFGAKDRVEYVVGNLPVILSAPHGGRQAPADIPNRTRGTLTRDVNTDLLVREIASALHKRTCRHAHVIICHLKRTKVDCNRNIDEGAQNNPEAEETWRAFHRFIGAARQAVEQTARCGIYLDIHGHAHPEARLELGCGLPNKTLKQDDRTLSALKDQSTIRALATRSKAPFAELLRGETSLGGLMQQRGFDAVPSPRHRHAGDAKYFYTGYNTNRYRPGEKGVISSIQVECPRKGIRDTQSNRKAFANAFADALIEYLKIHGKIDLCSAGQE